MGDRGELWGTLKGLGDRLPNVDERKMFGCEALFTNGAIFALVWKTGRIGVKLPVEERYGALLSQKGAEPWRAGEMIMAHWVLVPPGMEGDTKKLAPWVAEAHGMAARGVVGAKKKAAPKAKAKASAKAKAKAKK